MISDESWRILCSKLVPGSYLEVSLDARNNRENKIKQLLEKRKIPEIGMEDQTIEMLLNEISSMDSNNFSRKCGVGEREGRVICDLVKRRHYNFAHGIGRSGDLLEYQPKGIGSSLLNVITTDLLLDFIKMMGVKSAKKCIVVPMATGMSLMLSLLTLKAKRPNSKFVLWSRIDQKSCFKCMLTANLDPVIIDPLKVGDELQTNVAAFEEQTNILGTENILCILSTTSCFAPRGCDDIVKLAELSKKFNIPHMINNAYGLQSTFLTHQIEQAQRTGNVDLVIQSTDKNLLVPVGGSIIFGKEQLIADVGQQYCGRASISQSMDVFMTLLHLGKEGYMKLVKERKDSFEYLRDKLCCLAEKYNERVLVSKNNPISLAMSLATFDDKKVTMIGSMLFKRGVMGARVISVNASQKFGNFKFNNWGSHHSESSFPYLTAAASLGTSKEEIDYFIGKLDKVLSNKVVEISQHVNNIEKIKITD